MVRSFVALARASLLSFALVALVATSSGCTLILGGVGAGTPRSERVTVTPDRPLPDDVRGEDVRVRYRGEDRQDVWLEGRCHGVRDGALIVSNDTGDHAIALDSVREVRVQRGDYLARGLAVGAAIDGTLLLLTVVAVVFTPRGT